jgi:hypothetical protein
MKLDLLTNASVVDDTIRFVSQKSIIICIFRIGVLERKSYNETPPRVEYNLTNKGQELVESIINLLHWMKNCFKYGTIGEQWEQIRSERWLNPAFENFINKEIIGGTLESPAS